MRHDVADEAIETVVTMTTRRAGTIAVPFFVNAFMMHYYFVAFVIFILASFTDMLDGKIARARGLVTNFGKIMDPLADKILVYSALCLLIGKGTIPAWALIIILAREFAVSGMRTVAASEGRVIAAGMSGKFKTVLQMIAVPLLSWRHPCPRNARSITATTPPRS